MTILVATVDGGSAWEGLLRWANVTSGWELTLIVFGLVAQFMFFLRWVVQWVASERRGISHVPLPFWWLSLVGATLLLVYFFLRGEPVGLLGQSVGWVVYSRNLYLIKRHQRRAARAAANNSGAASDDYDWPI